MDLPLAEGELAIQLARLPELEAAISAAETRLAVLLGTYEADIAVATRGPARLPALQRLRPGAPVELLRRRPDIRAVERELAEATARIGVATADLFPSVTLTSGFGGQGTLGSTGTTPLIHGPIWSVGPGVNWPVLDFGRLDALINIQEMRTHEVLVRYKKTIIAAVGEVNEAVRQYRLDLQRWKALSAALEAIRHGVDLATERYKGGDTGNTLPPQQISALASSLNMGGELSAQQNPCCGEQKRSTTNIATFSSVKPFHERHLRHVVAILVMLLKDFAQLK